MANCHSEFRRFLGAIELSSTEIANLKRGRDALREKIEGYYVSNGKKKPTFCKQGSFAVKTTIRQSDADYDYDDGLYLKHLPEEKPDWPKTEDVHNEIMEAVDGHTETPPLDKTSCIRVQYKKDYHIDLAVYGESSGKIFLARKGSDQWEENNPKLFTDWFYEKLDQHSEQFRSICKYIKKWAYYKGYEEITGFLVTILCGNNFAGTPDRDDKALLSTLNNITTDLELHNAIYRPVSPKRNMTEKFTKVQFSKKFVERFKKFSIEAQQALTESDHAKACEIWRELLGDEFPESEEEKRREQLERKPSKIITETRPWGR